MKHLVVNRYGLLLLLVGLLALTGRARAAEFAGGDVYRLPADSVVDDDLYVGASEIYIDGTVKGDLLAAGAYVEINGTVEGDLIAAGAGINVRGDVGDDARLAGAGIDISGTIGDDLIVAGGGTGSGFSFPIQAGSQNISQGIRIAGRTEIGGDVILFGGDAQVAGEIGGDLRSGTGSLNLAARIGGNADIDAGTLQISDVSQVGGRLHYTSQTEIDVPSGVSARVEYEPPAPAEEQGPSLQTRVIGWVLRTGAILVGFAILGWLLLRFAPKVLTEPAAAIRAQPWHSGLYGLIATLLLIFVPLASILLVVLVGIFWGVFPAIALALFLFSALALIWVLSPLVTGLWLGQLVTGRLGRLSGLFVALLIGTLLLALVGRVPCLGAFVYLLSFILALGGLILARRAGPPSPAPAMVDLPLQEQL